MAWEYRRQSVREVVIVTQVDRFLTASPGTQVILTPDVLVLGDNLTLETIHKLTALRPAMPERIVVMNAYDVPSGAFETSAVQKALIAYAKRYQLRFEQADGIIYDTLLRQYVTAGQVVMSTGQHNAVFGVKHALGFNLTEENLLSVLSTGAVRVARPATLNVQVIGQLQPGVMLKDAGLQLLSMLNDRVDGQLLQIGGAGYDQLTADEQRDLLQLTHTLPILSGLKANVTAADITIDLAKVVPMVAKPGQLTNVTPLSKLGEQVVQSCLIGGATGSSIADLRVVANVLKGHHVPMTMRLTISPESNAVYLQALAEGLVNAFIDAGAQVIEPGYGSVRLPSKAVVGKGETQLTDGYWNYVGYNGTPDSQTFVASARTVAETALTQTIGQLSKAGEQ